MSDSSSLKSGQSHACKADSSQEPSYGEMIAFTVMGLAFIILMGSTLVFLLIESLMVVFDVNMLLWIGSESPWHWAYVFTGRCLAVGVVSGTVGVVFMVIGGIYACLGSSREHANGDSPNR